MRRLKEKKMRFFSGLSDGFSQAGRGLYDIALILQIGILSAVFGLSFILTVEFVRAPDRVDVFLEYPSYRTPTLLFLLAFAVTGVALLLLSNMLSFLSEKKTILAVFFATFIAQIIWIASLSLTNYWYADSISLMRSADAIINHDLSKFDPSSCAFKDVVGTAECIFKPDLYKGNLYQYFSWYPFQSGPLLWYILVFTVFGSYNVLAFQLVNAAFVSGIAVLLTRMANKCGLQKRGVQLLALLVISCIPLLMYSAFVYTNGVGVFWGLLALNIAASAFSESSTAKSALLLVLAFMAGAIGILIKSTYIIFLIAIAIISILRVLSCFKNWPMLLSLPLLVLSNFVSKIPLAILEQVTGQKYGSGMPMSAWVVIGLREEPPTGPGWWTSIAIKEYQRSGGDYTAQTAHLKATLSSLLSSFANDPAGSVSFFVRKIATEWAEPTFQTALYSSQGEHIVSGGLERFLLAGRGYKIMIGFDNVMQSMVYFLALIAIFVVLLRSVRHKETCNPMIQLLTVSFLGGFICYVFWEAKSVYTLPFYLLLLPLAALGGQYVMDYAEPIFRRIGRNLHVALSGQVSALRRS